MRDETRYVPMYSREVAGRKPFRSEVIADRKAKFASVLKYVTARQGWLTSVPGEVDVEMQCLPGSTLPDELRAGAEYMLGNETVRLPKYKLEPIGETQRILPHAIEEKLTAGRDGMESVTEGSTRPVLIVTHAGIVRVLKFRFRLP